MRKFSKASGYAFFSGFLLGKIRLLPMLIPILVLPNIAITATTIASLAAGLLGYAFWSIASADYPAHKRHEHQWYGFAEYKQQHLASAIIGILASALCIAGLFIPVLYPLATYLYLASNLFWCISEYHRLKNPPIDDPQYSSSYQKSYVNYTIAMTAIGLNTAIAATLVFLFPLITVPVMITTTIITIGLSALSAEFWFDFNYGDHEKNGSPPPPNSSYQNINNELGVSHKHNYQSTIELTTMPEPQHRSPIQQRVTAVVPSNDEQSQAEACHKLG